MYAEFYLQNSAASRLWAERCQEYLLIQHLRQLASHSGEIYAADSSQFHREGIGWFQRTEQTVVLCCVLALPATGVAPSSGNGGAPVVPKQAKTAVIGALNTAARLINGILASVDGNGSSSSSSNKASKPTAAKAAAAVSPEQLVGEASKATEQLLQQAGQAADKASQAAAQSNDAAAAAAANAASATEQLVGQAAEQAKKAAAQSKEVAGVATTAAQSGLRSIGAGAEKILSDLEGECGVVLSKRL